LRAVVADTAVTADTADIADIVVIAVNGKRDDEKRVAWSGERTRSR
jgi:hypothetical protein